ncbi:unnamed protein product [Heligmosomoides polygyrus]|uniref:DUF4806 domain-containing protein n=1 Tax=Heligmosomoides polygyrus TaxID=6339 RepID=A0A183FLG1_HELPZ|nr:unnamed protein product [Heligmosomoides polygyrus]
METKMLRWMARVTRLDRVRNDAIRQRFGVIPIAEKLREASAWKTVQGTPEATLARDVALGLVEWLVCTMIKHLIGRTGVTTPEERTPPPIGTDANENDDDDIHKLQSKRFELDRVIELRTRPRVQFANGRPTRLIETLELIRSHGAARASGNYQLTSELAKLCRAAIKEDLKERKRTVG